MHTCFIALASASVLHLPLCLFFRIRQSYPCLSTSPSGTLARLLSGLRYLEKYFVHIPRKNNRYRYMPLLSLFSHPSVSLFLFLLTLCRVVLFAVVDTRKKRSLFWTNRISSLLLRPVLHTTSYTILLSKYEYLLSLLPDLLQVPLLCSHVPCTSTAIHHAFLSCRLIHTVRQPFFSHALPQAKRRATTRPNQHCSSDPPRQPVADLPGCSFDT
ncbi:hypothetical protein CORC01_05790 [Colletotrichum orchidophilum]|uniref:Secreted protein n=1 Tax=Colletotrichum orchidophilum TaxID=1209926 RepID=A0A1G4BBV4_9PEZI|nr:uncharacterized protein CORC01_05790 [Colletotrichum orchidophilum]OHE98894.1 hypothetical protein CORC01_05790 [Colletotrichum orchidophilum]